MIRHTYTDIFDFMKRAPLSRLNKPEVIDALFQRVDLQWELFHWNRGKIEKTFVSLPWLVDLFSAQSLKRSCWTDKLNNRILIKCSSKYVAMTRISSRKKEIKDSPFRRELSERNDHQE